MPEKMSDLPKCHDFKMGDTIVFDPSKVKNWDNYDDHYRYNYFSNYFITSSKFVVKYMFKLELGISNIYLIKPKLYTFICEHSPQEDHGMIIQIGHEPTPDFFGIPSGDKEILTMVHLDMFRKATLEEC